MWAPTAWWKSVQIRVVLEPTPNVYRLVCAFMIVALTSKKFRARFLELPAQSLIETFAQKRKNGFEHNAKIRRQVSETLHSLKGMLWTFDLDMNKRCVLIYTPIIFRSGTRGYDLVQHLSPVHKNLVFDLFSTVGVPITFCRPACTYQEPIFEASQVGRENLHLSCGKSGSSVPGTND